MVNHKKVENYFTGISMPVISNVGGMLLELGQEQSSLFYKLDEEHYADVKRQGAIVQVVKQGAVVTAGYVLLEESLMPVKEKKDIRFIKKLGVNPSDYKIANKNNS